VNRVGRVRMAVHHTKVPPVSSASHRFTGPARAVRGLLLGWAVLLLTALAHTSADHTAPTMRPATLLWLLPLTVALSVVAADRRRSPIWLVAFLLGVQSLLHVLLVVNASHASHQGGLMPSGSMIVAHVLAAGAAAFVIAHADGWLHRWVRFLDCLTRDYRLLPSSLPAASRADCTVEFLGHRALGGLLGLTPHRRGPPLSIAG
jgi:hypothetical protein